MGVKTTVTLSKVQKLFPTLLIVDINSTSDGIIDTTYILKSKSDSYILKKYENKTKEQINIHLRLLKKLHSSNLNVPHYLTTSNDWYVFRYIHGSYIKYINYYSLKKLAILLRKIHSNTYKSYCGKDISQRIDVKAAINKQKQYYYFYKKFLPLKSMSTKRNGIIHGDISFNNILERGSIISILDFTDSADGRFSFDIAVILNSLCSHPNKAHYINYFLHVYNQNNFFKIAEKDLLEDLDNAKLFYQLLKRTV